MALSDRTWADLELDRVIRSADHCVSAMLDIGAGEQRRLFIIDELYRGTNTRERVAAAYAVLNHLDSLGHLCLVATHDLERLALLEDRWEPWHFLETVNRTSVLFDYRIRAGVSSAPNALRLLRRMNYPCEVVQRAHDAFSPSTMSNSRDHDAPGSQPRTPE